MDGEPTGPTSETRYFDREYFAYHPGKKKYFDAVAAILESQGLRRGGRVLDVGAGYGFLLRVFEERGYQAYGIEISEHAAEKSRSFCRAPITVQSAETRFPFEDDFFDAVVVNDVVEHLADPAACLREIRRTLAPNGIVFVQTLNRHSIAHLLLGKRWTWYQDPTHVHMFTPQGLAQLIRDSGLDVLRTQTFFNFCQVGETTTFLKSLRRIGRIVRVPALGDSFYVVARKRIPPAGTAGVEVN